MHYLETGGREDRRRRPAIAISARGAGLIGGVVAGGIGLLLPRALLESISYQLYLDTVTEAARPPLGMTASLVAAGVLMTIAVVVTTAIAMIFGLPFSKGNVARLIGRMRGADADDEMDAPSLRAADRHPDAPARRPLSAMRDIPVRDWDDHWPAASAGETADEDEDELLLDNSIAPPVDSPLSADPIPETPDSPLEDEADSPLLRRNAPIPDTASSADTIAPESLTPVHSQADDGASHGTGFGANDDTALSDADLSEPVSAESPHRAAMPPREPLDLSAARLEDLLARLEAGLARRVPAAVSAVAAPVVLPASATPAAPMAVKVEPRQPMAINDRGVAADAPAPVPIGRLDVGGDQDPAFPHDPALAAALATLRRLNQKVG